MQTLLEPPLAIDYIRKSFFCMILSGRLFRIMEAGVTHISTCRPNVTQKKTSTTYLYF